MAIPVSALLVVITVHSLWGGNPIAVKFGLEAFPPLWSAFFRFAIGISCVALWAWARGITITPLPNERPTLALLGMAFFLQIASMNIGISATSGSLAAILIATHPLFAAGFTHCLIAEDRLTPAKAFGLSVALAGTTLTLLQQHNDELQLNNPGNWILLASAVLLGGRLALNAKSLQRIPAARVILWQMLFSLPLFALGGWWFEEIAWDKAGWRPWLGLAYQGVVIAGLGFMVTSYLMQRYRPSLIMSFSFVSPLSGVLLGVWLLGEPLTWQTIAGLLTVALGLTLIARR